MSLYNMRALPTVQVIENKYAINHSIRSIHEAINLGLITFQIQPKNQQVVDLAYSHGIIVPSKFASVPDIIDWPQKKGRVSWLTWNELKALSFGILSKEVGQKNEVIGYYLHARDALVEKILSHYNIAGTGLVERRFSSQ